MRREWRWSTVGVNPARELMRSSRAIGAVGEESKLLKPPVPEITHFPVDGPGTDQPLLPAGSGQVTSYVRVFGLRSEAYHRLLHQFHSKGLHLEKLATPLGAALPGPVSAGCCRLPQGLPCEFSRAD